MIPKQIGPYEIYRQLSKPEKRSSSTFLGSTPYLNLDVVITVFPKPLQNAEMLLSRFNNIATLLSTLNHPGIVQTVDFGVFNGFPYLVSEFLLGGTLADRLRREKQGFSPQQTADILTHLAEPLDAIHNQNTYHGNLKPANIIFSQDNRVCVTDFRIFKLSEIGTTLTPSALADAMRYASPEQIEAKTYTDWRTDIYSAGLIVYEMLHLHPIYTANDPLSLAQSHLQEPSPKVVITHNGKLIDFSLVLSRALDKVPQSRYSSVGAMARNFESEIRTARPITGSSPPNRPPTRPRK